MTELKTLKDIEFPENYYEDEIKRRLKALAVKWVKEDKEWYKKRIGLILNGQKVNSLTMELLERWKKRFNLTEEELDEEKDEK